MTDSIKRRERFYNEQYMFGKHYIAHFLKMQPEEFANLSVLEIGGGEFGVLKALDEYGAHCVGIEISENRVKYARERHKNSGITFYTADICNFDSLPLGNQKFNIIIMRDVIEHIADKATALKACVNLLADKGKLFMSYPPIMSPFGGHQQNLTYGKFIPYAHLIPNFLYVKILKLIGARDDSITALLTTKKTGISIQRMRCLIRSLPLRVQDFTCYLIRPDYEIRFHLKQRRTWFNNIPILNEFITTGCLIILINDIHHTNSTNHQ